MSHIKSGKRISASQEKNSKYQQFINIKTTSRVINPEKNIDKNDLEYKFQKRCSESLKKFLYGNNGGIQSLMQNTPLTTVHNHKKLHKSNSFFYKSINLFDPNYGRKEDLPGQQYKRHYIDNKCFEDHIGNEGLIIQNKNSSFILQKRKKLYLKEYQDKNEKKNKNDFISFYNNLRCHSVKNCNKSQLNEINLIYSNKDRKNKIRNCDSKVRCK